MNVKSRKAPCAREILWNNPHGDDHVGTVDLARAVSSGHDRNPIR